MSFPTHLIKVNNRFYFKVKIPVDLAGYFPSQFIKKSLKTGSLQVAKTALAAMEYKTHNLFALLRTGILPAELVEIFVRDIFPRRQRIEQSKGMPLSHAIDNYVSAKNLEWSEKTKMEVKGVFRLLVHILGDIELSEISKPMVLELRTTLQNLPPNSCKKYPDLSIKQILSRQDEPSMSIKSVNKHIMRLGSLFRYCLNEGVVTSNPACGFKITEKRRADQERSKYSPDDIRNIVANLPNDPAFPERYWIPLIGLYSGMRLNEICQLSVEDVQEIEGVWCFDINEIGDKKLKNISSQRVIPVHPELIESGLVDYANRMRTLSQPRLWMNLEFTEINGYSNKFGKWFQRYNREYVTVDSKKVFHSMRHTVADFLKQAEVSDVLISEIMGHAHQSITMGRYGKRYQPKVLLEALGHLNYGVQMTRWKCG